MNAPPILFPLTLHLDTETSGLLRKDVDIADPSQPHIIEIAAELVDERTSVTAASYRTIIRPDGWTVEAEAEAVHGISEAYANRVGVPIVAALVMLQSLVEKATTIAIFNAEFDRKMIAAELIRAGGNGRWWSSRARDLRCIMEAATDIMRLPGQFGDFKFPSLDEAHRFFCPDYEWESGHRAGDDLQASRRVWDAIRRRNEA